MVRLTLPSTQLIQTKLILTLPIPSSVWKLSFETCLGRKTRERHSHENVADV